MKCTTAKQLLEAYALGERDFRYSDLRGSDLSSSNLRGSDLSYSDLSYSNLRDSDLSYSDLSYSNLRDSDLRDSDLRGSDLRDSNLRGSDLRGSDLRGSDLDFTGFNLSCKSVEIVCDKRLVTQLLYHLCRLDVRDCPEWDILRNNPNIIALANQSHVIPTHRLPLCGAKTLYFDDFVDERGGK
jgi:hypothetical protein